MSVNPMTIIMCGTVREANVLYHRTLAVCVAKGLDVEKRKRERIVSINGYPVAQFITYSQFYEMPDVEKQIKYLLARTVKRTLDELEAELKRDKLDQAFYEAW